MGQNTNNSSVTIKQGLEAANRQFDLIVSGFKANNVVDMRGITAYEDAKLLVEFFEQKLVLQKESHRKKKAVQQKPCFELIVGDSVIGKLVQDFEKGFTFVQVLSRCKDGGVDENVPTDCEQIFLHTSAVPEGYAAKLFAGSLITCTIVPGKSVGQLAAAEVICEEMPSTKTAMAELLLDAGVEKTVMH